MKKIKYIMIVVMIIQMTENINMKINAIVVALMEHNLPKIMNIYVK